MGRRPAMTVGEYGPVHDFRPALDVLLADGRVEVVNPKAVVRVYRTVHRPRPVRQHPNSPRLSGVRSGRNASLPVAQRHDGSRWTTPSWGMRKSRSRARERIARASRRRNR